MGNLIKQFKIYFLAIIVLLIAYFVYTYEKGPKNQGYAFFEALKKKEFNQAYWDYTSNAFQEETPFRSFQEYLATYPILINHKEVEVVAVEPEKVRFRLEADFGVHEIELMFVEEGGAWKITTFQFYTSVIAKKDPTLPFTIESILIGTKADKMGMIEEPAMTLSSNADAIFVNVILNHSKKGEVIKLFLTHIASGEEALPLSTLIEQEGEARISFSYKTPLDGWPIGEYEVEARSNGVSLSTRFRIE